MHAWVNQGGTKPKEEGTGLNPKTLFAVLGTASVAKSKGAGATRHPSLLLTRYAKRDIKIKAQQSLTSKQIKA